MVPKFSLTELHKKKRHTEDKMQEQFTGSGRFAMEIVLIKRTLAPCAFLPLHVPAALACRKQGFGCMNPGTGTAAGSVSADTFIEVNHSKLY